MRMSKTMMMTQPFADSRSADPRVNVRIDSARGTELRTYLDRRALEDGIRADDAAKIGKAAGKVFRAMEQAYAIRQEAWVIARGSK